MRYAAAITVPETRSSHHFESYSVGLLKFKHMAENLTF